VHTAHYNSHFSLNADRSAFSRTGPAKKIHPQKIQALTYKSYTSYYRDFMLCVLRSVWNTPPLPCSTSTPYIFLCKICNFCRKGRTSILRISEDWEIFANWAPHIWAGQTYWSGCISCSRIRKKQSWLCFTRDIQQGWFLAVRFWRLLLLLTRSSQSLSAIFEPLPSLSLLESGETTTDTSRYFFG